MDHTPIISTFVSYCIRKLPIPLALMFSMIITFGLTTTSYVLASATSNYTQTINAGILSVSIVNASYATVGSPSVTMSSKTVSLGCQTGGSASTGTFGTSTQQIYVKNPDAADSGWSVSLAPEDGPELAIWNSYSIGQTYDFNDPTTSGCTDGADTDTVGGQLTVGTGSAAIVKGTCANCTDNGGGSGYIAAGAGGAFVEGTTDSVTLLTASSDSQDIGDWTLQGVSLSQTIPAEQRSASDYFINFVLSVTAT